MHKYERIAIWVSIALIFLILFMGRSSGFANNTQPNLMSMAEFNNWPAELKTAYATNIGRVTDAAGTKVKQIWNSQDAAKKAAIMSNVSMASTRAATMISNLAPTVDSLMMLKTQFFPPKAASLATPPPFMGRGGMMANSPMGDDYGLSMTPAGP